VLSSHRDLFLEMHGADADDKRKRVEAIVEHLWAIGHQDIIHVESKESIHPANAHLAAQGHLYGRANGP
jgi:hypothetical protein